MAQNQSSSPRDTTLSIGALSKATGVPVETLRTWERRYGFPDPSRNDSGHRVYPVSAIERIRLTNDALRRGHRPKQTVGLELDALRALLVEHPAAEEVDHRMRPENAAITQWMIATQGFEGRRLQSLMRKAWVELGPLAFLDHRVQPFLFEVGAAWAAGRLTIAQEHFASERIRDFLAEQWRPLADRAAGPPVLCASLPGETHVLGLHMVALVFALAGLRVVYIGGDSPVVEIANAAAARSAACVAISVSIAANRFASKHELTELREKLGDHVELLVGGLGAPQGIPGVHRMDSLDSVAEWALKVAA